MATGLTVDERVAALEERTHHLATRADLYRAVLLTTTAQTAAIVAAMRWLVA